MKKIKIRPPKESICGEVTLLGSKSYSNRAFIAAALCSGESILSNVSDSDDTALLVTALKSLGVEIEERECDFVVRGGSTGKNENCDINVGPAGTTMRFLLSFVANRKEGEVVLSGSKRMHERPIGVLVDALRTLGASIAYLEKEGFPPLLVKGVGGLRGGEVKIDAGISSQYITSLLLVAPSFEDGLTLTWEGELISKSYVDMTLSLLKEFSVEVEQTENSLRVLPSAKYVATPYRVEGDASGGSYFWGLAAVTGGKVTVKNISLRSAQGDAQFPLLLERMGCKIVSKANEITVEGVNSLNAITTDMELMPDTAQTLAVVAALAEGKSKITGLSTLKIKETDRLVAVQNELSKVGIDSSITDESIEVLGGEVKPAVIDTYEDHRMAMSFALLGACVSGIEINDPEVVNKSFPTYWEKMKSLGVGVQ